MLVLSTKMEDSVQVGDDIRITVIDVRPRNVRLGIEAPQSINIRRDPAASRSTMKMNGSHASSSAQAATQSTDSSTACSRCKSRDAVSILIISRDQPLLGVINDALQQDGSVQSHAATSITEGKRRIAAQQAVDLNARPDLVLLDTDLSPQTAILFLRWLRQSESRRVIPVMALRGESTPHATAALLSAGANVVVSKDQPCDRLGRSVRAAIDLWRCSESKSEVRGALQGESLQEHVA